MAALIIASFMAVAIHASCSALSASRPPAVSSGAGKRVRVLAVSGGG